MACTKLHLSFQNYLRQLFKPHRWKCDPLEANKETQQEITCEISDKLVYFWEKVSVKKKHSLDKSRKKHFLKKIQAKTMFFDKIQGEISQCFGKTS